MSDCYGGLREREVGMGDDVVLRGMWKEGSHYV